MCGVSLILCMVNANAIQYTYTKLDSERQSGSISVPFILRFGCVNEIHATQIVNLSIVLLFEIQFHLDVSMTG